MYFNPEKEQKACRASSRDDHGMGVVFWSSLSELPCIGRNCAMWRDRTTGCPSCGGAFRVAKEVDGKYGEIPCDCFYEGYCGLGGKPE